MLGITNINAPYKGYTGPGIDEYTVLALTGSDFEDKSDNHFQVEKIGGIGITADVTRDGRPSYQFKSDRTCVIELPLETARTGSDNWTIEYWLQPGTCATSSCIYHQWGVGGSVNGLLVGYNSAANTWYRGYYAGNAAGTGWTHSNLSLGTLTTGNWYHCAWTRYDNKIYRFLNGTLVGSTAYNIVIGTPYIKSEIGRYSHNNVHPSFYLQDFRISSTARYIATFTPPDRLIEKE